MGYVFVLIIWFVVFCFLAFVLAIVCFPVSLIIFRKSEHKIRKIIFASLFPGLFLILFFIIFNFELMIYAIVSNTDPGLGDFSRARISSQYSLESVDGGDWFLSDIDNNKSLVYHVENILDNEDAIIVSSHVRKYNPDTTYYILYEVDTQSEVVTALDTASVEQDVWTKYVTENNIDRGDICSGDDYYWTIRKYWYVIFLVLDIIASIAACVTIWKIVVCNKLQIEWNKKE